MLKIMRKLLNLDRKISHLEERYTERGRLGTNLGISLP